MPIIIDWINNNGGIHGIQENGIPLNFKSRERLKTEYND